MEDRKIYAVLTGDIVGSSRFEGEERNRLLKALKDSFTKVEELMPDITLASFEIHRGDSFQGVLSKAEEALSAALIIRAGLRHGFKTKRRRKALDARVAVGIGSIDYLPRGKGSEGDGEAYRRSGPVLDKLKRNQRLSIRTPWPEMDAEFKVECALLDALINRWSSEQAQVIIYLIAGWTQKKMAGELNITQPAVRQRLRAAGAPAIQEIIERYKHLIHKYKSRGL